MSTFTAAGWNIGYADSYTTNNIWYIADGSDYPRLWFESTPHTAAITILQDSGYGNIATIAAIMLGIAAITYIGAAIYNVLQNPDQEKKLILKTTAGDAFKMIIAGAIILIVIVLMLSMIQI